MWVAICNPIPQIGGFLGAVPFVALGLTQSAVVGVICLVVFLVYQQTENHVLQPLIIGRAVRLTPPATMVAALDRRRRGRRGRRHARDPDARRDQGDLPRAALPGARDADAGLGAARRAPARVAGALRAERAGAAKKPRCTMCVTVSSIASASKSSRRDTRKYANRSSSAISAEIDAASPGAPASRMRAAERGGDVGERTHAERGSTSRSSTWPSIHARITGP